MSVASSIGSPFYPPIGTQNLNEVLIEGSNAELQDITNIGYLQCNLFECVGNVECATVNGLVFPEPAQNLASVLFIGNNANGRDITNVNNINLTTINDAPYPPPFGEIPTLFDILTSGDSGTVGLDTKNIIDVGLITCKELQVSGPDVGDGLISCNNFEFQEIQGVSYPQASVAGAFPGLGAIKILDRFSTPALTVGNITEGVPTTILTFTLPIGIYLIKTEIDMSAGGSAYDTKVSINYNSGAGAVLVGFQNVSVALNTVSTQSCLPCVALVQSNGTINGLTVVINFLTGGLGAPGIIATDSDIDIIRLF